MKSSRIVRVASMVVLAAGITAVVLRAQETTQPAATEPSTPATQPAAHVSPEASAVLDKVRTAYTGLTGLNLTGTVSIQFDGGGQKRDDKADFNSSFRSPNKFRHDIKDEDTIISTGEKLYAYLTKRNQYLELDPPKTRTAGLPDQVSELLMDQDPSLYLAFSPDAAKALSEGATDIGKADDVDLAGTRFTALKITTESQDTTVLVDPATFLVRQVSHDLSRSLKSRGVPNVTKALAVIDYTTITPSDKPVDYAWTPPADAKPMKLAEDTSAGGNAAALEGKPAPAFALKDLDGKQVSLESLKGQVVVLDFWATWCGPCREGLPIIQKLATERAGKAVKVMTVNLQEENAQVAAFVKEQNLTLQTLLDSDGAVAKQYAAEAIPETVIIGKDGVVRKVIVGVAPEEEKVVGNAIDAALAAN